MPPNRVSIMAYSTVITAPHRLGDSAPPRNPRLCRTNIVFGYGLQGRSPSRLAYAGYVLLAARGGRFSKVDGMRPHPPAGTSPSLRGGKIFGTILPSLRRASCLPSSPLAVWG